MEIILTKTTKEFLVYRRLLDDEATVRFSVQIAVYEPTSHDCSLNEMVENLNDALPSVLDSVAPLKTKKKFTRRNSPWLRNKSVSKKKNNVVQQRENGEKQRPLSTTISTKML